MGLFDDVLRGNQTLIKNEEALSYDFLPKLIPYRENEQKYLATCIKPLFNSRNGRNLLIYGAPGIGKSAAVRSVLRELEEQGDEVIPIYVNCWSYNTSFKIMMEICEEIGYKFTQNKKGPELQKIILNHLKNKSVVFVFDEIDKAEDLDFMYFILENIQQKCIFLITNYKSWLLNLDERIRSRLMPELVEFKQYNLSETRGILKERLNYAFVDNCLEDKSFEIVVKKTFDIKDIRAGLFLFKESAMLAEEKSHKKISEENVLEAIKKLNNFSIKNEEELSEEEKFILDVVKKNSGEKIGDLFKKYEENGGKQSYKTFQRKIAKLDEGKYLKATSQKGVGGNTTIVERRLIE
ncbi:MAG: Cdc6/Cdc18 family protein [Candidatus Woesearchaeota archaeon]